MANDLFAETEIVDPNKNYIEELVGENKKFKTVEDLARSVVFKDHHIGVLETENKTFRTNEQARQKIEDLIEKLASTKNNQSTTNDDNQRGRESDSEPGLKLEDVDKLVEQKVTQAQLTARREANLAEVNKQCRNALGPNFAAKLNQQAQSLGLSKEYLNGLAGENPTAFYRLMGLESKQSADIFTPPSDVNTFGLNRNIPTKKTDVIRRNEKGEIDRNQWNARDQMKLHDDEMRKAVEMGVDKYLSNL